MARQIDFTRVSTKLVNLYSTNKVKNTVRSWKDAFKGILTGAEVERLFELFSGSLFLLESTGSRNLQWSKHANKDNFTSEWCKNIFAKYGITTQFGPHLNAEGKMMNPRQPKPAQVVTVEDRISKLEKELNRLQSYKQAKDRLSLICETADISLEDLVLLIEQVKKGV